MRLYEVVGFQVAPGVVYDPGSNQIRLNRHRIRDGGISLAAIRKIKLLKTRHAKWVKAHTHLVRQMYGISGVSLGEI